MPFGLVFRRAVLWHDRQQHVLRSLIEEGKSAPSLKWAFRGSSRHGVQVRANFEGPDSSVHRLPYVKTDCSGTFPVVNNSLARVSLQVQCGDNVEQLTSDTGAVLEMGGFQPDQRD
jgi:hypothetical protein